MKSAAGNRPTHIVKGNIFDALGFSASEASALKIKAEILSAILEHVRAKGYTQAQLVHILDEYQPSVSSLLKGRISQVSIEKLLRYADRLHLQTSIAVQLFLAKTTIDFRIKYINRVSNSALSHVKLALCSAH
jgi:predicted XRE-type DNA-binding protein